MMPMTRYLCPLPLCGWHHDEPDVSSADLPQTIREPAAADPAYEPISGHRGEFELHADPPSFTGLSEMISGLTEQILLRRTARVEGIVKTHFESHPLIDWIREVQRLNSLLASTNAPLSDGEEPPC
jgi:hypothetical protein